MLTACDPPAASPKVESAAPAAAVEDLAPALALARVDLAKACLQSGAPDEALAMIVEALETDPKSEDARSMAADVLTNTRWHLPDLVITHEAPIDHIEYAAPSALWVSLAGNHNTTVRWDLESLAIQSVLFPLDCGETRSQVFDPDHRFAVIERAGITLLCNAQTLKPIRDLGLLPDFVTPSSTVVFSPDGVLLAHPAFVSASDHSIVWHLRDSATGEILRSSDPAGAEQPRPIAASLNRMQLEVLLADGSPVVMPVSPVEPVLRFPSMHTDDLLFGCFTGDGGNVEALVSRGPHQEPELRMIRRDGANAPLPTPMEFLARNPWTRHPGIWSGLLRQTPAVRVSDADVVFPSGNSAPIHAATTVTAITTSGDQIIVGEQSGQVTFHRVLPSPLPGNTEAKPVPPDAQGLATLRSLACFLSGITRDSTRRAFTRLGTDERIEQFHACDFDSLTKSLPDLDFGPLVAAMKDFKVRFPAPAAMAPLNERIARASSVPDDALTTVFDGGENDAVLAAIRSAGHKGAAAAKALELALASTHPEWIEACVKQAHDLPPLLHKLAVSRHAWLQDRRADAIADWPEVFPKLAEVRLREDWDGWEQADFSQALEKLRLCVGEQLAAIEIPAESTPEQRNAVYELLSDSKTVLSVGKNRYAKACLKAALALSAFKDESQKAVTLANIALSLGESPATCLRAEAMALTALGDYQNARDRWITLITDHPVADQQPGDYAEAAYTSFENADPRQAMAILTTGLHRFPNDANFALRAGWVALLTGNAERAYRFLLTGRQIGYPQDKVENATALLAIAAEQTGAAEDAAAFYQDLIALDPAWKDPNTLETLEWPEELKASLRQLVW